MRIVTLNTWQEMGPWRERWEVAFKELEQIRPEILLLQEVFNMEWAEEIRRRLKFETLVKSGYHSGLVILTQYPVTESGAMQMKTQSPTEDYFRYAMHACVKLGPDKLSLFNTHLSWKISEGGVREKQVEELLAFISNKCDGQDVIVTGDFNATYRSGEITKMIQAGQFHDSYADLLPNDPGFTWDNSNTFTCGSNPPMPDRRIDYLFYRGKGLQGKLKSVRLCCNKPQNNVYASDHFGVLAEFSL